METITIYIKKGGSGKTTTTHSLASALTELGKKVLVIDIDPQGSLGFLMSEEENLKDINDVMMNIATIDDSIIKARQFDYIQSSINLTKTERDLASIWDRESILKVALENSNIKNEYDYCLIDCPPDFGTLTLNALTASDSLLIPCQCEPMAIDGLNQFLQILEMSKDSFNPKLEIKGIIPTMLSNKIQVSKEAYEVLNNRFEEYGVFSPVRENAKLKELGVEKKTIFEISKRSFGARDYLKIAKELINGI
ncbi:MAG: ParA family protein [Fusobacteriaceae bacterium]|nr:ParA family protein [Fusobacteriaceae bacterium]MBN2839150.1 ParA family protein [Fusobacteriaceae bacterium]